MNKTSRKTLINGLIAIAIYVVISLLPAKDPLTPAGVKVCGILIAEIYGLITMGNPAIPAFAALILFGCSGYTSVMGAFMSGFGHYAVVMIIGLMLVGAVIVKTGIARTIAVNIINSKLANGRPWVLTLLIIIATYIPAMFLTIPTMVIVWEIVKNINEIAGFKKGDKWPGIMMASVLATACFAGSAMPFSMGVSTDFNVFNSVAGGTQIMPSLGFLASSLVFAVLFIVVEWLAIRFVFRPDVSPLTNYKGETESWSRENKYGLGLLVIFIVLSLAGDILPKGSALQAFFGGWGVIGASYFVVFLALLIPKKDGEGQLMDIQEIANNGLFWGALIMIISLMVICGSMSAPELGIGAWLSGLMEPLMSKMGAFGLYLSVMLFALVGTNLLDNSLIGLSLGSIIGLSINSLAIPGAALILTAFRPAEFGILLPASAPNAAMCYGQCDTGWIDRKTILICGLVNMAVCLIVMILGYPSITFMY